METEVHRDGDRTSHVRHGGEEHYYFGPFRLDPRKRILYRDEVSLRVAARSVDLLLPLLENAGLLVASSELRAGIGGAKTGPSSLRVYMSALRRALGASTDGREYFLNEHGRGYVFVATVTRGLWRDSSRAGSDSRPMRQMVRLVGREATIGALAKALGERRLVSIVGPGGIGKSSVAAAFVERHASRYADNSCFFDLALIDDAPERWPTTSQETVGLGARTRHQPEGNRVGPHGA